MHAMKYGRFSMPALLDYAHDALVISVKIDPLRLDLNIFHLS